MMFSSDIKDEDFMSELEAATQMRPATSATLMLFSIIALMIFGFVWAAVSEVEEITRGQGKIVPTQDIQVVQSLEGGILSEILVREGEQVKKDQVILRLDDLQFATQERGTEARSMALRAKKARLESESSDEAFVLDADIKEKFPKIAANEQALYDSRQKELKSVYAILDDRINKAQADLSEVGAQINRLYSSRKLLNEELSLTKEMVKKRAVPKLDQIRLEREISDISGQINALAQKKKALEAEKQVAETERSSQDDKFRSQALTELNDVEAEISGLEENLKSIGDRVYRAEIRAPVDGVVNALAIKTIGGIVEPAMPVVEIVPLNDELKAIARVVPEEIAFLRTGQDVKIKLSAYDPQKYGALPGKLVRIASNSVVDKEGNVTFEIEALTARNYMGDTSNPLPIMPGMVADVEVITGKRTILNYLLKPVLRARDRAFTER